MYRHFGQVYTFLMPKLQKFFGSVCNVLNIWLFNLRNSTGNIWCGAEGIHWFRIRTMATNIWQCKGSDSQNAVFSACRSLDCSWSIMYVNLFYLYLSNCFVSLKIFNQLDNSIHFLCPFLLLVHLQWRGRGVNDPIWSKYFILLSWFDWIQAELEGSSTRVLLVVANQD